MHEIGIRGTEELYKVVEGWTASEVILFYKKFITAQWFVKSDYSEEKGYSFLLCCRSEGLSEMEFNHIPAF